MNKTILSITAAMAAVCILAFTVSKPKDLKTKLQTLSGTYADAKPYSYGKAWGQRIFTFDKGKWTLKFTLSLDPALKMQVFEFRTHGTYQLQNKSTSVADTYEAVFYEDKKFLTLKTDDENLKAAFGFPSCQLIKDVEKDISVTGCSAWKPVKDCPGDYDLLSMDKEGKLYFGNRPADNDMCSPEKRPISLTPPVVKK
jgi:hypothetical protein